MLYGCTKKINATVALPTVPVVVPHVGKRLKKHSSESSETWKVYKRLLDPKKDVCRVGDKHTKKGCRLDLPTVDFLEKENLKCTCFDNVLEAVHGVSAITSKPNHQPPRSWLKETNDLFKDNQRIQFPLSTVVVRWQLKKNLPGYDIQALYRILSKFGAVRSIRMTSPNSAIVTFEDLLVACMVVNSQATGEPHNYLHSRFWHKTMENKAVYTTHKGAKVRRIPCL